MRAVWNEMLSKSELKTVLTTLLVACMVVSNVLTAKQMALPLGLSATCGVVLFPVTYALSDVFSECYGYRWSRLTCHMAFLASLVAAIAFQTAIAVPPSPYWEGQAAFAQTLGGTPRILSASLAAFLLGDLANDVTFRRMKAGRNGGGFCARAMASSVVGELVDSAIFYPVALFGVVPADVMAQTALLEVCLKLACEALAMPVTARLVRAVGR